MGKGEGEAMHCYPLFAALFLEFYAQYRERRVRRAWAKHVVRVGGELEGVVKTGENKILTNQHSTVCFNFNVTINVIV